MAARPGDGAMTASEFGALRAYLARVGVSQARIAAVIGTGARGRSRAEITGVLREWLGGRL